MYIVQPPPPSPQMMRHAEGEGDSHTLDIAAGVKQETSELQEYRFKTTYDSVDQPDQYR